VDLITGEVIIEAKPDSVRADQLVEAANKATDSVHSFNAKLKKGTQRVKRVRT